MFRQRDEGVALAYVQAGCVYGAGGKPTRCVGLSQWRTLIWQRAGIEPGSRVAGACGYKDWLIEPDSKPGNGSCQRLYTEQLSSCAGHGVSHDGRVHHGQLAREFQTEPEPGCAL